MKKACFLLAMMALLMLSAIITYAFRPDIFEAIASPLSIIIIGSNLTDLIVEEYKTNISILESSAEVDTLIKIRYIRNASEEFYIDLDNHDNLKLSNKSNIFLNGDLYLLNYSQEKGSIAKIIKTFNPNEELIIKASYEVPTKYSSISSPKSKIFSIYNPVIEINSSVGKILNKSINICEINVKFPDDFRIESDNADAEKNIVNGTYNSVTKSSCPYLFFSKYEASAATPPYTPPKAPLMLPYLHPLVALVVMGILIAMIIGLSLFYFVKNRKLK